MILLNCYSMLKFDLFIAATAALYNLPLVGGVVVVLLLLSLFQIFSRTARYNSL